MKLHITKQRSLWWTISAVLIIISLISMVVSWQQIGAPLRPSLDFVGGTRIQLERDCSVESACAEPVSVANLRDVLAEQGYSNSSIQLLDTEGQAFSIRTSELDVDQRTELLGAIEEEVGALDPRRTQIDTVGPTIGRQIFRAGISALLVSFFGITAYLSIRFRLDYAVLALVALFHDVFITMGVFSILGLVAGREIDSLFIVALLTIVGFSVNDTVVIYDRIRETSKLSPERDFDAIVDDAVNQTLARSINTTLTTTLTLVAIVIFGGETLKFFALALIVGFILGAYSSIFVASTLLGWWRERHPVAIDAADADADPNVDAISETDGISAPTIADDADDYVIEATFVDASEEEDSENEASPPEKA
ncbi:MAG: protein translocase subunit SecF [Leptolyngbyaceae bacterium]|nr:protein translocase subunit SecF [Leptolyngbyaceae bacterium]